MDKREFAKTVRTLPFGAQQTIVRALAGEESHLVKVLTCGCRYLSRDYGFTYEPLEKCEKHKSKQT